MYDCHVWVHILPTVSEIGIAPYGQFDKDIAALKRHLSTFDEWEAGLDGRCIITMPRGDYVFVYHHYTRASPGLHDAVVGLLTMIAHRFPGSFGVMYSMEDDLEDMRSIGFTVHVIRRGTVEEYQDTYLSPYWVKIEDLATE